MQEIPTEKSTASLECGEGGLGDGRDEGLRIVRELCLQLAPASLIAKSIEDCLSDWPHPLCQQRLVHHALDCSHVRQYPAPRKWRRDLLRHLDRVLISRCNSDGTDVEYDDDFVELIIRCNSENCDDMDASDAGYISYPLLLRTGVSSKYIPFAVMRSHNQVGTRVWGAGVFLAELLQRELQHNSALLRDCTVLELGAGVGITGLLLIRYSEMYVPRSVQLKGIVLTDFHPSVVEVLQHNVDRCCREDRGDAAIPVHVETLDWSSVSEEDFRSFGARLLIAADCTYSLDGNVCLVQAIERFFLATTIPDVDMVQRHDTDEDFIGSMQLSEVWLLLEKGFPLVLIACTVRNRDTYQHFLSLLQRHRDLMSCAKINLPRYRSVLDSDVNSVRNKSEADTSTLLDYFYGEDVGTIDLLCIHPSSQSK